MGLGIGDLFSGLVSAIGSICSSIGGTLGIALTVGLTALNPILRLIIAAIPLVAKIIELLAPKEIDAEDIASGKLAVMAEESPDIKPENFESVSDYIKALKENADMEKVNERMKNFTPEQKEAYQMVSLGIIALYLGEKLETSEGELDLAFLAKANVLSLSPEKIISFIKDLDSAGISTSNVNKYLEGTLRGDDVEKTDAGIKTALEKLDESLTTEEQKEEFISGWSEKIAVQSGRSNNGERQ
jgi:hypothetical protein